MKRRKHSAKFKAQVVIEVLREEMSLNEIASKYELNPNLVRKWKSEAVENMETVFANKNKEINTIKRDYEGKIDTLYKEIGRLTTELSWIKKKSAKFNV